MGKIRRKRSRGTRYNPLRPCGTNLDNFAEENDICEESNSPVNENGKQAQSVNGAGGLNSIIEKISSVHHTERITSLNVLASLALEQSSSELIVKHQLVSSVGPLLQDPNFHVRLAAAGALRNLCAGCSDEVVEEMIRQDVLHPLSRLFKEFSNNVPSKECSQVNNFIFSKEVADSGDSENSIPKNVTLFNIIHLLWNLCECNADAMRMVNKDGIISILLHHINPSEWGYPISIAAADCLLCLTEDNPSASSVVLQCSDNLISIISNKSKLNEAPWLHYIVTIAGILININYCSVGGNAFHAVFEILSTILDIDINLELKKVDEKSTSKVGSKSSPDEVEYLISAQQLAFEILSNFCCSDDEEWIECDTADSDGEMESEEDEAFENGVEMEDNVPEVLEAIKHYDMGKKTMKKILAHPDLTQFKKPISEKLLHLLCSCLLCFQNLVSCLDLSCLGGSAALCSMWKELGAISFGNKTIDSTLLESACGTMRAIIDKISSEDCDETITATKQDIEVICISGIKCSLPSMRANVCRMLGNFSSLTFKGSKTADLNAEQQEIVGEITKFLLQIASTDPVLWVCAEALDTLIDIYSDDKTDKMAGQLNFINGLRIANSNFKAKFNEQRKRMSEHRALILTVRDNLSSFIKYKAPRAAKYAQSGNAMVV